MIQAYRGSMNSMKLALLFFMTTCTLGCHADPDTDDALVGQSEQALSDVHHELDIIGVSYFTNTVMDGIDGSIFVQLGAANETPTNTKLMLMQGTTFQVLDSNGTDRRAEFLLPPSTSGKYEVYTVAIENPMGGTSAQNCVTDGTTGVVLCNQNADGTPIAIDLKASKGKPVFADVAPKLLHVCGIFFTSGEYACYDLFNDSLQGIVWHYDEQALRRAHLRFYPKQ
jgi:hypothetical protein